ncbi:MAG: hypothetical protein SNJ82_13950, partial [Gemmataceae bacterium]
MGKKPLLTLAGLFLASVASLATGCGQCTQCSTRPGKFPSTGPQAKAPTPAVGDTKRTDLAQNSGPKVDPPPKADVLPASGFDRRPDPTPMKPVPPTYSGDPPPQGILEPSSSPNPSSLPGRDRNDAIPTSRREPMPVPPIPTTRTNRTEESRLTRPEEFRALPMPNDGMGKVPGVGDPTSEGESRSGFAARPVPPTQAITPPAPPAPAPVDLPPRTHPAPPPLPAGVEPKQPSEMSPGSVPPGSVPPSSVPPAVSEVNSRSGENKPTPMPPSMPPSQPA